MDGFGDEFVIALGDDNGRRWFIGIRGEFSCDPLGIGLEKYD